MNITICDRCNAQLQIPLIDEINLRQHQQSKSCKAIAAKVKASASQPKITSLLRHVFASPAASDATAAAVQPVTRISSPSSTSAEEIVGVEVEAEGEHDACKSLVVQFRRCEGYLPPVPQPFSSNWPFAAHANINPPCTFHQSGLRALDCAGFAGVGATCCDACSCLQYSQKVQQMVKRANDGEISKTHLNNVFLTYSQFQQRYENHADHRSERNMIMLNLGRKVHAAQLHMADYDRMFMALADADVMRVRDLIATARRQNRSIAYITDLLYKAANGLYHAKGYTEKDGDLAYLILKVGGPMLLTAVHKAGYLPSVKWVYKHLEKEPPALRPFLGVSLPEVFAHNIQLMLLQSADPLKTVTRAYHLLMDEVAVESRLSWNPQTNMVTGICFEHCTVAMNDLSVDSIQNLHSLREKVISGDCHVASEVLAIMAQCYDDNEYQAVPLLLIPSCKSMPAEVQYIHLQEIIEVWYQFVERGQLGPLLNADSDGQHQRRKAFHDIFRSVDGSGSLDTTGMVGDEVRKVTSTMWLLDNLCGPHNMTAAFDLKHIWKRYRTLLISTSRSSLILGDCLTRADLQVLLTAAGYDSSAIQSMFNPVDKQNVPSACKLLKAVADLVDVPDIAVSSTMLPQLERARLFGHIVCGLLAPVIELDASISDLLVKISKSAHILFVCFRSAGSKFIPTVLYHDTQAFVQTVFWNIIKLQVFGQEQAYHIHQQGTDSGENLFGHMRTLTHNSNFNVAEANTNISTAHQIHKILEHHPEWSRGHKRLKATEDHINPTAGVVA